MRARKAVGVFEVRELSVRVRGTLLRRADVSVATGQVGGLLGPGAGLLVRTAAGLLVPAAGTVRLDGDDLSGLTHAAVVRSGVTLVLAGPLTAAPPSRSVTAMLADTAADAARVGQVLAAFPDLEPDVRADRLDRDGAVLLAVAAAAARGSRLLLAEGLAATCGAAAYAAAITGLRTLAHADDAMALLAEEDGDARAYDVTYVIRDGTTRRWITDPG